MSVWKYTSACQCIHHRVLRWILLPALDSHGDTMLQVSCWLRKVYTWDHTLASHLLHTGCKGFEFRHQRTSSVEPLMAGMFHVTACKFKKTIRDAWEFKLEIERGDLLMLLYDVCWRAACAVTMLRASVCWRWSACWALYLWHEEDQKMVTAGCLTDCMGHSNWNWVFGLLQLGRRSVIHGWLRTVEGQRVVRGHMPLFHQKPSSWAQEWSPPRSCAHHSWASEIPSSNSYTYNCFPLLFILHLLPHMLYIAYTSHYQHVLYISCYAIKAELHALYEMLHSFTL
jgi:hypothetical protein